MGTYNLGNPIFDAKECSPRKAGRVLALVFEWTGLYDKKPVAPEWVIKLYSDRWPKERYQHDTGGYEWLEVVAWCELPPVNDWRVPPAPLPPVAWRPG